LASPATTSVAEDSTWNLAAGDLTTAAESPTSSNETLAEVSPETAGAVKTELKALARQSSHYMAALIGNLCLGLVSFPVFTRVLPVSEYGIMDLGQRLLLMLTIASKLGFQNASLRFYNRKEFERNPEDGRRFYSTIFFGMLATALTVGVMFQVTAAIIPQALMLGPLANLVYMILGLALLRAVGSILWGFLRIEERTKTFSTLQVSLKATTLAVVCALFPLIGHFARVFFVAALSVETILILGLTTWLLRRDVLSFRCFDSRFFRIAMAYGAPLVAYEFSFAVLGSADRFLVRHYVGANALGLYSVACGLANNVNEFLVAPINLALVPIYMRIWTSDGPEKTSGFLRTAFDLFVLTAVGLLAAASATGHSVLVLLASSKYSGADQLIPVILSGLLIWTANVFVGAGLLIHKKTLKMAGILVISAIANILLNCLLLPKMGLMGGAVATLLSYLICIVLLTRASHRLLPLNINVRACGNYAIAGLIAWLAGTLIRVDNPALSFLCRSSVVMTVYLALLYAFGGHVRTAVDWTLGWIKSRRETGMQQA
jgi:O-antigen/teichoic acid export membrane protein